MTKRRSLWQEQPRASGATTFRVRRRGVDIAETFEAKADGRRWAAETIAAIDRGSYVDPRDGEVTLAQWSPRWLETKRSKSGSYQNGSDGLLRNWVLPRFGKTAIAEIRQDDVIAWIGDMTTGKLRRTPTSKPLSASKVAQARLVLSGCLELAVGLGVLSSNQANTKLVRQSLPRVAQKTIKASDVPSEWDVAVIVSVLAPSRWSLLAEVLAYGALRLGEGLGLRGRNVSDRGLDLTHAVGHRATAEGGGILLKPLKGYDERFVPLPPDVLDRLSDYLDEAKLGADDLVFPGEEGGLMWPSTFHHTVWLPALAKARRETGDRFVPFKAKHLRNFGARRLLEVGANVEQLRAVLGHKDIRTTQRYLTSEADQLVALASAVGDRRRDSLRLRSVSS